MTAEELARRFHETYERLAPQFGYKTREASAVPWEQVPENNKRLMIAVCKEVLVELHTTEFEQIIRKVDELIVSHREYAMRRDT